MLRRIYFVPLTVALALVAIPALASNDPLYGQQWALPKIQAEKAWATGTGNDTTIAIIDTGVDLKHIDLADKLEDGRDFVDGDSNPQDVVGGPNEDCPGNPGHGTHVAGIAAAITDNRVGIAGVAPHARIMPVRVLNQHGCGSLDAIVAGIRWATDNGATIINLSLGEDVVIRNVFGSELENAINYAWSKGVIPVVAAGNDSIFPSGYRDTNTLVVAATDRNDQNPGFSNDAGDAKWGLSAPGHQIVSTIPGNKAGSLSGTSMAAPHVAGAAAVVRCLGLSKAATVQRLLSTSDDIGLPGNDLVFGHGRINMARAVQGLSGCRPLTGEGSTAEDGGSGGSATSTGKLATAAPPPKAQATATGQPGTQPKPAATQPTYVDPTPKAAPTGEGKGSGRLVLNLGIGAVLLAAAIGYFAWMRRRQPGLPEE